MSDQDYYTLEAMDKYGGSFVSNLANLARVADHVNFAKIKSTWPEYWAEYEKMGLKIKKDRHGNNPEQETGSL